MKEQEYIITESLLQTILLLIGYNSEQTKNIANCALGLLKKLENRGDKQMKDWEEELRERIERIGDCDVDKQKIDECINLVNQVLAKQFEMLLDGMEVYINAIRRQVNGEN
jgi:hypothetical protein